MGGDKRGDFLAPTLCLAEAQNIVDKVIALSNAIEHCSNLFRVLIQLCPKALALRVG
jgi:hypothetical protein